MDFSDRLTCGAVQVEKLLPLFPNLKQVDMCRCGIADEEMAALSHTVFMLESYSSTNNGWRHSPHYYAGRDLVGGNYIYK